MITFKLAQYEADIMESYDQIQGFEYWNIEAWKNLVKEHVLPLHESVSKLLGLRELLVSIVGAGETTLSEVEKKEKDLLPFLLGGIKEDGAYKDNSFAKIIRLALGVYVNPREWVTLEKEERLKAFEYVKVKIEDTIFLKFSNEVKEIASNIIKSIGNEASPIEVKEVPNPKEVLKWLEILYTKSLQASANHSYYTFSILSIKSLPWKFIQQAYSKLKDNFGSISALLGLKKCFEPKLNEEEKKEDYCLLDYSGESLGENIYNLNDIIWKYFGEQNVKNVFSFVCSDVKDLKQDWMEQVNQKLTEMKWKFPAYIETSYGYDVRHVYSISGPSLLRHRLDVRTRGNHPWSSYRSHGETVRARWLTQSKDCNISLLELLDDLSPALFLGAPSFELKISEGELEIIRR